MEDDAAGGRVADHHMAVSKDWGMMRGGLKRKRMEGRGKSGLGSDCDRPLSLSE